MLANSPSGALHRMGAVITAPSFLAGVLLGSVGTAILAYRVYLTFYRVDDQKFLPDDGSTHGDDTDTNDDTTTEKKAIKRKQFSSQKPMYRSSVFNMSSIFRSSPQIEEEDDDDDDDEGFQRVSFFTEVIRELWQDIKIAVAQKVRSTVEPKFQTMSAPMNSCRLTKVDLGDVPLRLDNIRVHSDRGDNPICNRCCKYEIDIVWDGECDIRLHADYFGSFGVKGIKLSARMSFLLKPLIGEVPVVSCVQYAFCNLPEVDLNFTGLGRVANVGIIKSSLKSAIQSALVPYCLPNRSIAKIAEKDDTFFQAYTLPIGILRVWVEQGNNFAIERRLLASDDIPDVYFNVSLGVDNPVWKTETINNECNPTWGSDNYRDFLVWDAEQLLKLHAWDHDDGPLDPDDDLGYATISVARLLLSFKLPSKTIEWDDSRNDHRYRHKLPLYFNGKKSGATVTVSAQFGAWTPQIQTTQPTLLGADHSMSQKDTGDIVADTVESIQGVLVILINRAFHLKPIRVQEGNKGNSTSSVPTKIAKTFVRLRFAGKEYDSAVVSATVEKILQTLVIHPVFESAFSIPLLSTYELNDNTPIVFELIDATANEEDSSGVGATNSGGENASSTSSNTEVTSNRSVIGSMAITVGDLNTNCNGVWTGMRKLGQSGHLGATSVHDASQTGGAALEFQARLHGVSMQHAKKPERTLMQRLTQKSKRTKKKPKKQTTDSLAMEASSKLKASTSSPLSKESISNEKITESGGDQQRPLRSENTTIRIKVVSARGLKIEQGLFGLDIPSCYCELKVVDKSSANQANKNQNSLELRTEARLSKEFRFRTSTTYNLAQPIWNEHKDFVLPNASLGDRHGKAVEVVCDLWNEQMQKGQHLRLGTLAIPFHKLYDSDGSAVASTKEFQLKSGKSDSGIFLMLECSRV